MNIFRDHMFSKYFVFFITIGHISFLKSKKIFLLITLPTRLMHVMRFIHLNILSSIKKVCKSKFVNFCLCFHVFFFHIPVLLFYTILSIKEETFKDFLSHYDSNSFYISRHLYVIIFSHKFNIQKWRISISQFYYCSDVLLIL